MASSRARNNPEPQGERRRLPPAATPEQRELQLQSLAFDLVEQRLMDGTATSQETTYFLKQASAREKAELEKIRNDNLLTQEKISQIKQMANQEVLLAKAMQAFAGYSGNPELAAEYELPDE